LAVTQDSVLNALVGAAFGAAGQRCMALSVAIMVGETKKWIPELVEKTKGLKVGPGTDPTSDIGPMLTKVKQMQQSLEPTADCCGLLT
jgi:malonate-semialdehyde dehydrogenase (acetylating)/methylmalonate-semialdehyde dehydrogenase